MTVLPGSGAGQTEKTQRIRMEPAMLPGAMRILLLVFIKFGTVDEAAPFSSLRRPQR